MANIDVLPEDRGKKKRKDSPKLSDIATTRNDRPTETKDRNDVIRDRTLSESPGATGIAQDDYGAVLGDTRLGRNDEDANERFSDSTRGFFKPDKGSPGENNVENTGGGIANRQDDANYTDADDLGDLDEGETIAERVRSGGE
jgi:hypothetical protein